MTHHLSTLRLVLREWRETDLAEFAALNADGDVRKHFPSVLSRADSDAEAARNAAHFEAHGFGLYAVEIPGIAPFIGFTGVYKGDFDIPALGTHWTEIGWRLARTQWGHGYATEAAHGVVDHAFRELHMPEIIAMTAPANRRSRKVMEKLGMTHDPADDFDHPRVPVGHPLRRHVLYRLKRPVADT